MSDGRKHCPISYGSESNVLSICNGEYCAWWYEGECVKIAEVKAMANLRTAIVSLQKVGK